MTGLALVLTSLSISLVNVDLVVTLEPAASLFKGSASISSGADPVIFELGSVFEIKAFDDDDQPLKITSKPGAQPHLTNYSVSLTGSQVRVDYVGILTGDRTESGVVRSDGVLLPATAGWYPLLGETELALRIEAPEGWSSAVSGGRDGTNAESAPIGIDGVAVAANRFNVRRSEVDGVQVTSYFLPEHNQYATLFLSRVQAILPHLAQRLGNYPYRRLNLVENWTDEGYGFEAMVVLGRDAIAAGDRTLRTTFLDHEIAHAWIGNHVFVDPDDGNWSEGLVHYLSDHAAAEANGEAAATRWRYRLAQRYSAILQTSTDYPLRQFQSARDEIDRAVGYDKSAMLFHGLRRHLGDDTFYSALRLFVASHGAQTAGWDDLRAAFEQGANRDLRDYFEQWTGRTGLPRLSLDSATSSQVGRDAPMVTTVTVSQSTADKYRLQVPIAISDGEQTTVVPMSLSGQRNRLKLFQDKQPLQVSLDPHFHIPRQLTVTAPSLWETLHSAGLAIVHPGTGPTAEGFRQLATTLAASYGADVVSDDTELRSDRPLLLLGGPLDNRHTREFFVPPAHILLSTEGVVVDAEHWTDRNTLIALSERDEHADVARTIVFALSPEAITLAALHKALWDRYAVVEHGQLVAFPAPQPQIDSVDLGTSPFTEQRLRPTRGEKSLFERSPTLAGLLNPLRKNRLADLAPRPRRSARKRPGFLPSSADHNPNANRVPEAIRPPPRSSDEQPTTPGHQTVALGTRPEGELERPATPKEPEPAAPDEQLALDEHHDPVHQLARDELHDPVHQVASDDQPEPGQQVALDDQPEPGQQVAGATQPKPDHKNTQELPAPIVESSHTAELVLDDPSKPLTDATLSQQSGQGATNPSNGAAAEEKTEAASSSPLTTQSDDRRDIPLGLEATSVETGDETSAKQNSAPHGEATAKLLVASLQPTSQQAVVAVLALGRRDRAVGIADVAETDRGGGTGLLAGGPQLAVFQLAVSPSLASICRELMRWMQ